MTFNVIINTPKALKTEENEIQTRDLRLAKAISYRYFENTEFLFYFPQF